MGDPLMFVDTNYGFRWGPIEVTRLFSDKKRGWVVLSIKTAKQDLQVYVTKTGKVRIHGRDGREWTPPEVDRD